MTWRPPEHILAPEQLSGDRGIVCRATDRWQLGLVLLQLLCRRPLDCLLPPGCKASHMPAGVFGALLDAG